MQRITATRLTEPLAHHGEGAIWDARLDRWLWVDMLAGRVMVTDGTGATRALQLPDTVAALVRPHADGGHVVVGERTVWWVDLERGAATAVPVEVLPIDASCRANEGACSPSGLLSVGSMAYAETGGAGNVWSYRPDGTLVVALPGTTISNGTVFTTEEAVVFTDSATGQICRYSVGADGSWTDREVLVTIDKPGVGPDGICMDVEAGIWVALWDGSRAQRFDATGALTHEVLLPTKRATSVALGGADGRTLFVTTSAVGLLDDALAGACFTARVEVPGHGIRPCRVPSRP